MNIEEKLRREAELERPAFSADLHDRIVDQLRTKPRAIRQWNRRWLATAAAVIIAAGVWSALRLTHPQQESTPDIARIITPEPIEPAQPISIPDPSDLQVNIHGILTATLWPPSIGITLPVPSDSPLPETADAAPNEPTTSPPQWLLAGITQPATSASAALTDMMPPNLRALIALNTFNRPEAK